MANTAARSMERGNKTGLQPAKVVRFLGTLSPDFYQSFAVGPTLPTLGSTTEDSLDPLE